MHESEVAYGVDGLWNCDVAMSEEDAHHVQMQMMLEPEIDVAGSLGEENGLFSGEANAPGDAGENSQGGPVPYLCRGSETCFCGSGDSSLLASIDTLDDRGLVTVGKGEESCVTSWWSLQ